MASYHLSVKTVQRSAGRSATAAAAYRHAARIPCEREGRVHDYRAKSGVEASFILAPEDAPAWATDRTALWNAAEARETRGNSVTAREWELALPSELDGEGRRLLVAGFAAELVSRYGVAADVAIHAPHREGDQRNHHAHVLTTTRALTGAGLTEKTRVLDAKQTGGPEIAHMRERWAALQNQALEQHGHEARVDHRSLTAQREQALAQGDERTAEQLDRAPEVKLGPVVSSIERREQRTAERERRRYVPLTERGTHVHELRQARHLLAEVALELGRVRDALQAELRQRAEQVRERAEAARETYSRAREEGADRISAGLAALRAAAQRQGIGPERAGHEGVAQGDGRGDERGREAARESIRERLERIVGREAIDQAQPARDGLAAGLQAHEPGRQGQERSLGTEAIRERLEALRERTRPWVQPAQHEEPGALTQDEPSHERPAYKGGAHEAERDEIRHRPRDDGWDHGL